MLFRSVSTFLGAHALPEEYAGRSDEYIDFLIREMLPLVRDGELAECCDVFCEQGVFSIEQSRRLLQAAGAMPSNGEKGVATIGPGIEIGPGAKIGPSAMVKNNVKGGEEQW